MKKWFRFPIEYLWVATVLVGIFAFVDTHPIRPQDFWFHMAVGKEILATGQIPAVDTFSHTAVGQAYPSYNNFWLMDIAMYLVFQWGGAALIVFFHSIIITTAYFLIFLTGWRGTGNLRAAAYGTLFAAALGLSDWNVRPQVIAFLIGAMFLYAIGELQRNQTRLWLIVFPMGMPLWVNSHGSFVIGIVLVGTWVFVEIRNFLRNQSRSNLGLAATAFLLSCIFALLNPRGPDVYRYTSGMAVNPVIQNLVSEWASPTFDTINGQLFLGGFMLMALVLAISPKRPNLFQLIVFLGFGTLGLKTLRGSIWFGLLNAPTLADHLSALMNRWTLQRSSEVPQESSSFLNGLIVITLGLLALLSIPWFKEYIPFPPPKAGLISSETPIEATQKLLEAAWPTQLFHTMSFGSYLDWAAQPDYPVFVDSRIELYPPMVWRDYLTIGAALPGWEDQLKKYNIQTLMLSVIEHPELIAAAEQSNQWQHVYEDKTVVVFTRR